MNIKRRCSLSRNIFEVERKREEKLGIEEKMNAADFWDNPQEAQEIVAVFKELKATVDTFDDLLKEICDNLELVEMVQEDEAGNEELGPELEQSFKSVTDLYAAFRVRATLSGEFDRLNGFLSIHAGAGGTEACDWAAMLLRMYTRWFDTKGWTYTLIDENSDVESGYKSVMLHVKGSNMYGYMKGEVGVHRLVRISPFDAKSRRHTSFAAVDVIPEYLDDSAIELNEKDLKIDTFRSSGAGGQHVNTTDSAVRITHLPTGIIVQCQNERSQHKNKAMALKVLKARLEHIEKMKKDQKMKEMYGEKGEIAWGNQIRSYVLTPYTMVRDHRTDHKVGDFQRILDGDLDGFVSAYLEMKAEM